MEIGGRSIAKNPRDSGSRVDRGCAIADHAADSIGTAGMIFFGGGMGVVLCGGVTGRLGRGRTICFELSGGELGDVPLLLRLRNTTKAEKTKARAAMMRMTLEFELKRDFLIPGKSCTVVEYWS